MKYDPLLLDEREAHNLYQGLSDEQKQLITEKELANEIAQILIKSGDLKNRQEATEQGEKNGLINTLGSRYSHDDTIHATIPIVVTHEKGSAYIMQLIKKKYPNLDEDKVLQFKKEEAIKHSINTVKMLNEGFRRLPTKLIDLIQSIVNNNNTDRYIYIRCSYEDEQDIVSVFDSFKFVYKSDFITVLSVEEIAIILKYNPYRNSYDRLWEYLCESKNSFFIIDRIEDAPQYKEIAPELEKILSTTVNYHGKRVIFLSECDPRRIEGVSEEIKRYLLSASYYDFRDACIESKKQYEEEKKRFEAELKAQDEEREKQRQEWEKNRRVRDADDELPF